MDTDLFGYAPDPHANLLPYDGIVNDYGVVLNLQKADACLHDLLHDIAWQHDQVVIYGKRITTARQVAWYGDSDFGYNYSGVTRHARVWTPLLLQLKHKVEQHLQAVSPTTFNSCLLNRYHSGQEGMAWHSDDEAELGHNTVIASLSLGAMRKFAFRHKRTQEKRELLLQHGQLIVMRGCTQHHWQHAVMKSSKIQEERVSLTFRTYCAHMAEKAAIENGV